MTGWPYTRSDPPLEPPDDPPACPTCGGAGELDEDGRRWCECEKEEEECDDEQ